MTDETKPAALGEADKQAEAWAERQAVQIERAIQIIVGATTTVLAGFLSQVWGSASIPLRKELANDLHAMGVLFTATFSLTAMRMGVELYKDKNPAKSQQAFGLFTIFCVGILMFYTTILSRIGDAVSKAAAISN